MSLPASYLDVVRPGILLHGLEPSEREPAQREAVAAYFRPLSKTLGALSRQLAARRAALAALPPVTRTRVEQ